MQVAKKFNEEFEHFMPVLGSTTVNSLLNLIKSSLMVSTSSKSIVSFGSFGSLCGVQSFCILLTLKYFGQHGVIISRKDISSRVRKN